MPGTPSAFHQLIQTEERERGMQTERKKGKKENRKEGKK
jgi:hypothetical protein